MTKIPLFSRFGYFHPSVYNFDYPDSQKLPHSGCYFFSLGFEPLPFLPEHPTDQGAVGPGRQCLLTKLYYY